MLNNDRSKNESVQGLGDPITSSRTGLVRRDMSVKFPNGGKNVTKACRDCHRIVEMGLCVISAKLIIFQRVLMAW